ncbi:MAG: NADP(H)-dependent aldo-keto reductase [Nitrospirae bacterium]|nr:NADP(H)-dependent aldo-keto reductase [Nitrospirota bacterium]
MHYRPLGSSGIHVSVIALGTMTWGEQNTEAEAHAQLDYAVAHGVNFIDSAEIYPVPPKRETCGETERIIGTWLKRRGRRDDVILATKVAGNADWLPYVRDGHPRLNRTHMEAALEGSLKRLGTDRVDLYQLHWPDRATNFFGELGYRPDHRDRPVPIEETLSVLADFVKAGKVRHIGVSNETPWGLMRYLQAAEHLNLPRIQSVQNPYNLLNRVFEIGCAEIAHREGVGLLAYSPLAFGVLTGKYLGGAMPEGARLSRFERFSRYRGAAAERAAQAYVELARRHGLEPARMALAYVNSRQFLTSTIVGATTMEQLAANIASADLQLSEALREEIEAIHHAHANPCP